MTTPERAIEDDLRLASNAGSRIPAYVTVRPTAGNGAIIRFGVSSIRLTVEEREKVARALWPDAFKEGGNGRTG